MEHNLDQWLQSISYILIIIIIIIPSYIQHHVQNVCIGAQKKIVNRERERIESSPFFFHIFTDRERKEQ